MALNLSTLTALSPSLATNLNAVVTDLLGLLNVTATDCDYQRVTEDQDLLTVQEIVSNLVLASLASNIQTALSGVTPATMAGSFYQGEIMSQMESLLLTLGQDQASILARNQLDSTVAAAGPPTYNARDIEMMVSYMVLNQNSEESGGDKTFTDKKHPLKITSKDVTVVRRRNL